jgi:histidinol-phosphate aminotransferase
MEKLARKLSGKSVLLIDEAYVDFAEEDCVGLVDRCDNVIILRSMSKGYSLAGLRFGYAIAPAEMIAGLRKVKDSYNVNAIAIAAATAAIRDRDYFKSNVEKIKAERRELTDGLRDLGFDVPESSANFVLARCTNCNAEDIYKSLADRKIYVRYFKLAGLDDKLRITVGTQEDNHQLLGSLKEILSSGQA